jgi:hypothetical protein
VDPVPDPLLFFSGSAGTLKGTQYILIPSTAYSAPAMNRMAKEDDSSRTGLSSLVTEMTLNLVPFIAMFNSS